MVSMGRWCVTSVGSSSAGGFGHIYKVVEKIQIYDRDERFGSIRGASCKGHLGEKKVKGRGRSAKAKKQNAPGKRSRAEIGIPCSEIGCCPEPNLAGREEKADARPLRGSRYYKCESRCWAERPLLQLGNRDLDVLGKYRPAEQEAAASATPQISFLGSHAFTSGRSRCVICARQTLSQQSQEALFWFPLQVLQARREPDAVWVAP
ncbi:hypothetical protein B0T14DRAFT_92377 [Immersiella caudata]|uniref:Uncharacterized protein n=1 Tax=Immersiella caudata TaxID=314043 RepID=A0AA40C6H9_9PEZI|nr:hypothetical protein B0T14DRAFT_92377 [Immersiella caudata]